MILSQPFPTNQGISRIIRFTSYAGCIVFLILILFQPFGFHKTPSEYFFRNAFFFGFATFLVATTNALLLPFLFPRFCEERSWTVSRELGMMLWQVISISFINLLLFKWLYNEEISGKTIIEVLGITAAVGIFPITLIILLKQYALLKKYGSSAAQLDQQIHNSDEENTGKESPLITVCGESQHESVSFPLDDFRFISAADNYIKLHFIKDNKLSIQVLRTSLKKLSERFQQYEQVFRCHRTYLVNLSAVDQVTGNAQGYKLRLKGVDERVPVSRNLNKELTTRLKKITKTHH